MLHDQEESPGSGGFGWSRSAKKPKQSKAPPQRGLGVAQLEKIFRQEDEKIDDNNKALTGIYYHPPAMLPPPATMPPLMTPTNNLSSMDYITKHLPVIDNYDHLSPPLPTLGSSGGGGGGGGVYETGGPARIFPGHEIFSSMWSSHEPNSDGEGFKFSSGIHFPMHFPEKNNGIWPSPPMLPTKHCQYPPWLMYPFMPSASLSPYSSASGMNHQTELPSNQRSYNYTSIRPEEDKTVGIKRRWPFAIDDDQTDSPSSCGYGSTMCFEPSKPTFSFRDSKKEVQPKLNPKKGDTDCGTLDANFLTLGFPAISLHPAETFSNEFPRFYSLPLQESTDDLPQSSGHSGSSHGKPFYSFLPPNTSSIDERGETGGDGVDLNLKLSVGSFNEPIVAFF